MRPPAPVPAAIATSCSGPGPAHPGARRSPARTTAPTSCAGPCGSSTTACRRRADPVRSTRVGLATGRGRRASRGAGACPATRMSAAVDRRAGGSVGTHGRPRRRRAAADPARAAPSTSSPRPSCATSSRGPAAAREARHRPDRVRHPPRVRGRAAQAAPVPGPRPHRRAHHRRLHRPGRRPERAVGDPPARSRGEEVDAHAETYVEQVAAHPRCPTRTASRSAATPSGSRRWTWTTCCGSRADDRGAACSSATTSPSATKAARRSRSWSCCTRCSRAGTRSRCEADVELGGTDQLFNNLMGRHLQEQAGQEPQVVLTTPLLEGIDGGRRCRSRSATTSGIAEPPGRAVRQAHAHPRRAHAAVLRSSRPAGTPTSVDEVAGELGRASLRDRVEAKRLLARTVVDLYHGDGAGAAAEAEFDRVFREHAAPTEVPSTCSTRRRAVDGRIRLARVLRHGRARAPRTRRGAARSPQGGVRLDGERGRRTPTLAVAAGRARRRGCSRSVGGRWARIRAPDERRDRGAIGNVPGPCTV